MFEIRICVDLLANIFSALLSLLDVLCGRDMSFMFRRNSYSSDRAHYRDISPRKFRQPARGFHGSRVGLKCSPRGSKTSRDSHSRSRDRTHTRREETSSFDSQPNNR